MTHKFVDFEQPPVVEVVCGVTFQPIPGFVVAHLGRFWDRLGAEFDQVQEALPLAPMVERFEPVPQESAIDIPMAAFPRVLFISHTQDHLVQIQRDRFLGNWRKLAPEHPYPSYDSVFSKFEAHLASFERFISEQFETTPQHTQYELAYINHVFAGEGWNSLGKLGELLPDCAWRGDIERFLPVPESIDWRHTFVLPEQQGRLHVRIRSAERTEDKKPVLLMELTARGFSADRRAWFDLAHEWIVRGFADLTDPGVQGSVWRRKQA